MFRYNNNNSEVSFGSPVSVSTPVHKYVCMYVRAWQSQRDNANLHSNKETNKMRRAMGEGGAVSIKGGAVHERTVGPVGRVGCGQLLVGWQVSEIFVFICFSCTIIEAPEDDDDCFCSLKTDRMLSSFDIFIKSREKFPEWNFFDDSAARTSGGEKPKELRPNQMDHFLH